MNKEPEMTTTPKFCMPLICHRRVTRTVHPVREVFSLPMSESDTRLKYPCVVQDHTHTRCLPQSLGARDETRFIRCVGACLHILRDGYNSNNISSASKVMPAHERLCPARVGASLTR